MARCTAGDGCGIVAAGDGDGDLLVGAVRRSDGDAVRDKGPGAQGLDMLRLVVEGICPPAIPFNPQRAEGPIMGGCDEMGLAGVDIGDGQRAGGDRDRILFGGGSGGTADDRPIVRP